MFIKITLLFDFDFAELCGVYSAQREYGYSFAPSLKGAKNRIPIYMDEFGQPKSISFHGINYFLKSKIFLCICV